MPSRDDGSIRAPIVWIGEAYGKWESIYDRPLTGPSWTDKMLPWLRDVGLKREDLYITNAWDQGQPANINAIPEHEMRASMDRLHQRLAALEGPDGGGPMLIVPTGNVALYALTGHGRVSFHLRDGRHDRPGIFDWRGSILEYQDQRGRRIKVIPTLHPASTFPFRTPGYEWVCRMDWQRIATDAQFRERRLPERNHIISPSWPDVREWLRWSRNEAAKAVARGEKFWCSLDVETPKDIKYGITQKESTAANGKCRGCGHTKRWHTPCEGVAESTDPDYHRHCKGLRGKGGCECTGFQPLMSAPRKVKISEEPYLDCVGYSWNPAESLTIPTTLTYWQDPALLATVRAEMAAFHADPNIDFGGQNFSFDNWWCSTEGMPIARATWDLMKMHAVQRPWSEWNDLAFQVSLDTREPYFKSEAKDPDSIQKYVGNSAAFWTYNGKDNCTQRELRDRREEALRAGGRWDYYNEVEAPVEPALAELTLVGIRVDEEGRRAECERVKAEATVVAKEINETAGVTLVAKVAVSTKAMKAFLYGPEGLRLPEQRKKVIRKDGTKEKAVTVDIVALKRLMEQFPTIEKLQAVGKAVLRHRRLLKIAAFLSESHLSTDGRVYGQFKQDTSLGRLSCGKLPNRKGHNMQNIDRKLRKYYLPDTGEEICV